MKLLSLLLTYFKGIVKFSLSADGNSVNVFGANGTGKTTIADAVNWLLFGKDTANKNDFGIKTLDAAGVAIPGISHEVEATFSIRGDNVTLKKEYVEVYTRKRGSTTSEFTGHETNHYIDGVPKSKKEYDAFINDLVDEKIFKMLTNPLFFNSDDAMKNTKEPGWKVRRNILLAICGDISDQEVIDGEKSLDGLATILGNRSLDDHKKVIAARRAKINEELTKIPVRIDEAQRALPDVSNLVKEYIVAVISGQKAAKQDKEQEISRIQNGGEVAEQQKLLAEVNSRIVDIQTRFKLDNADKSFAKKQELQDLQLKFSKLDNGISTLNMLIESENKKIEQQMRYREELLKDWHNINDSAFSANLKETCPTCEQSLPADQLEEARSKALAQFNFNKSNDLAGISEKGKKVKEDLESAKNRIADNQAKIDKFIIKKDDLQLAITVLESEINGDTGEVAKIEDDLEYIQAIKDKAAINEKIIALKVESETVIDALKSDIRLIETTIRSNEYDLLKFGQVDEGNKRIAELADQEKQLAAEFEKLESELNLVDQFIRTKVAMLEDRINSKFKIARFKLFEQQVNGGLNEVCETLGAKGVPYGSGLNQAARINVGLDIINTLSDYYGFVAPIFVDNRESVTDLIDTKAQVISLIVSPNDKTLKVEVI